MQLSRKIEEFFFPCSKRLNEALRQHGEAADATIEEIKKYPNVIKKTFERNEHNQTT